MPVSYHLRVVFMSCRRLNPLYSSLTLLQSLVAREALPGRTPPAREVRPPRSRPHCGRPYAAVNSDYGLRLIEPNGGGILIDGSVRAGEKRTSPAGIIAGQCTVHRRVEDRIR